MASMSTPEPSEELPSLKSTFRLGGSRTNSNTPFFDVKFFPFTAPGVDPIFAAAGASNVIVCRPSADHDRGVEIIQWFRDQDENVSLNSVAWAVDPDTGDPLVCATGSRPDIKVLHVKSGKILRTLRGHGGEINDLQTCPTDPAIVASASGDNTIRLWHLGRAQEKQPTIVICASHDHKAGFLTLGFHSSGRYIVSGGFDTRVSVWALPNPLPATETATDRPPQISFPHFSTTDLHTSYVDCVACHGPVFLSRSAQENRILVWRIDGFDPTVPPESQPDPPAIRSTFKSHAYQSDTRSAWGQGYTVLLSLDSPHAEMFYMRFGLFPGVAPLSPEELASASPKMRALAQVATHPVLAMGNGTSRVFFWDLHALEDGQLGTAVERKVGRPGRKKKAVKAGTTSKLKKGLLALGHTERSISREDSVASSEVTGVSSNNNNNHNATANGTQAHNQGPPTNFGGQFAPQRAHKIIEEQHVDFAGRTTAWSVGGEWCVTVGDWGMMMIFRRWADIPDEADESHAASDVFRSRDPRLDDTSGAGNAATNDVACGNVELAEHSTA